MSRERLAAILDRGDDQACLAFFQGMPEKERRSYAQMALASYREYARWRAGSASGASPGAGQRSGSARIAVFACCTLPELKKARAHASDSEIAAIFRDRKPEWLDAWAVWWCEQAPMRWSLVRRLIREGLCARPGTDAYILGMIVGLCIYCHDGTVYAALLADPELLEEDVWRIFEVEGDGELTLAARDKYARAENTWTEALVRLAREQRLPRARLLDVSLEALKRDFKQFHAGWFSRLHEAMEPTHEECVERADSYLELLASKIPPTVTFALSAVLRLHRAGCIDDGKALAALRGVLWSRAKGTVKDGLKLLESIAQRTPELREEAAGLAIAALAHESAQVQQAALGFLAKHAAPLSPALAAALSDKAEGIAASLKPRFASLLPSSGPRTPRVASPVASADDLARIARARNLPPDWAKLAGVDEALRALDEGLVPPPAPHFGSLQAPRLDPQRVIVPIADLDELIDAFAHVLEEPDSPPEVERVFDGLSRLCDRRPADFKARTGPLVKRARQKERPTESGNLHVLPCLCELARAWVEGVPSACAGETRTNGPCVTIFDALRARIRELAERVAAGRAAPLLAAPTHAGSWIDPRVLVARAAAVPEPGGLDRIFCLLRIAPEGRAQALPAAAAIGGEWGDALRYALGGPPPERVGPTAALWVAAARCRASDLDDPRVEERHPGLGPDAGGVATTRFHVTSETSGRFTHHYLRPEPAPDRPPQLPADLPAVLLWPQPSKSHWVRERCGAGDIRWALSVWPARLEGRFALAAKVMADNRDWWEAQWANKTRLEPLVDPDTPLTPMALLLLAVALAAKEPGEQGMATDALIAAVDDARVDEGRLGAVLAQLLPTGLIKAARWAKALGQVARVSPLHVFTVSRLIQHSLRGDPAQAPHDISALLELLRELLADLEVAVTDAAARTWLEHLQVGGRTGRLVREILASKGELAAPRRRSLAACILEKRILRGERWARIARGP